jgi:hypothetical protein
MIGPFGFAPGAADVGEGFAAAAGVSNVSGRGMDAALRRSTCLHTQLRVRNRPSAQPNVWRAKFSAMRTDGNAQSGLGAAGGPAGVPVCSSALRQWWVLDDAVV